MEKQMKRALLLFSLILVIIPMVIFPNRLGMQLISGSAIYMLYEFVFYGIVLYLFRRQTSLVTILIGSALTLVYRMGLGAAFGLTVIVMYAIDSTVAFSLGMGKYLPAVILHVAAAPFVMRTIYLSLADNLAPARISRSRLSESEAKPLVIDRENESQFQIDHDKQPAFAGSMARFDTGSSVSSSQHDDGNQFERAVAYIGESASVKMALLIDEEGLPLARFSRCQADSELWAPLAIVLEKNNRRLLQHYQQGSDMEKLDIGTRNMRILLRRLDHVTLMVLAEQNIDETILIRIAQAADMVRKYMSERYSPALFARVEERYVSNS